MSTEQQPEPVLKYADKFASFIEAQNKASAALIRLRDSRAVIMSAEKFEEIREAARQADLRVLTLYNEVLTELQQLEEQLEAEKQESWHARDLADYFRVYGPGDR
jgi:PHD/YefM family antitoxin component YafN of YafNO toxin-antitoxin module